MSKIAIAFDNLLDAAILTGGSWAAGLPLNNLKTVDPSEPARTSDASNASTKFDADLKTSQVVKLVALPHHNASLFAKWRVRVGNDPTFTTHLYDSGEIDIWRATEPFGERQYAEFTWGSKLDSADSADFRPIAFVWIGDTGKIARYVRVEIFDANNVKSYFQAGRAYVSSAFQPTINLQYGAEFGFEDNSRTTRSRGGQPYTDVEIKYRVFRIPFEHLTTHEAHNFGQEIGRIRGKSGDMIVILNPEDTDNAARQSLYCKFQDYGKTEYAHLNDHRTQWIVEEII